VRILHRSAIAAHVALGRQGWKRMFFLDPGRWLADAGAA